MAAQQDADCEVDGYLSMLAIASIYDDWQWFGVYQYCSGRFSWTKNNKLCNMGSWRGSLGGIVAMNID